MILLAPAVVLVLAAGSPHALDAARHVTLSGDVIRIADVLPSVVGNARRQVIAHIPTDLRDVTLTRAAIVDLARRAVPDLRIVAPGSGSVTFVRAVPNHARAPAACKVLLGSLSAGATIDPAMTAAVACSGSRAVPVRFDRAASTVRAATDLTAGAYLGRLKVDTVEGLQEGDAASLVSAIGPVRIVRRVTAVQASHGRHVFVRDADGQIFSVKRAELAK